MILFQFKIKCHFLKQNVIRDRYRTDLTSLICFPTPLLLPGLTEVLHQYETLCYVL